MAKVYLKSKKKTRLGVLDAVADVSDFVISVFVGTAFFIGHDIGGAQTK